ncbi:MAG: hypothetical protein ACOVS5_14300, partial [Oligoflexus sp.]
YECVPTFQSLISNVNRPYSLHGPMLCLIDQHPAVSHRSASCFTTSADHALTSHLDASAILFQASSQACRFAGFLTPIQQLSPLSRTSITDG